jgi:Protein of unknown function (DUF1592)/Protein of unknown function (DUF1588)/Protein of unknown function (DUF1595)/Protein of unknown function (DUF1587)/Protein of unknown function (DUF1585)
MYELKRQRGQVRREASFALAPLALWIASCSGDVSQLPDGVVDVASTSSPSAGSLPPLPSNAASSALTSPSPLSSSAPSLTASGAASAPTTAAPNCDVPAVDASPMRRLTRREYNNVVRDLLGDTTKPASQFVAESAQSGFTNGADSALLSALVVDDFERAATSLALAATTASTFGTLVGCDPSDAAGQDACAAAFISSFGARAFRRELEPMQLADYQALYTTAKARDGFTVAIELVIRAILQSPYFLYRLEFGAPDASGGELLHLAPEEVAARLSFLLWGTIPDAPLNQAAREGKLSTPEQVREQATRLLMSENGKAVFGDFHVQWGQLATLPNQTKPAPFSPDLGRLLIQETEEYVDQTLRKGDGTFTTLLTSPTTYLNQELANYYGISGVTGTALVPHTFTDSRRAGFLTQGSIMGNFAHGSEPSPVLRGKFILSQLICAPPQPPPDNADTTLPAADPNKSPREQLIELTGSGSCAACHALINPPGFAFESFDGLGRYREVHDNGLPIDATSNVVAPADLAGNYTSHEDFVEALANSATVRQCVATKWFIYAHGRLPGAGDECSVQQAAARFKTDGNIRELLLSITESPAFLYYRKATAGAQP